MEIIAIIAALAAAIVASLVAVRWWTWRPVTRRRVLVQTDAGVSFDALVLSKRGELLVLGDVTVRTGEASRRVDGRVVVERSRVQWMQVA